MKRLTWFYVAGVAIVALLLITSTVSLEIPTANEWKAFFIIIAISMVVQVITSAMLEHRLHIPHMVFHFAGVLLLPQVLIITQVIIIALIDWEHKRREGNPSIRDSYRLPLKVGVHLTAALSSYWVLNALMSTPIWIVGIQQVVIITLAAFVYTLLHHFLGRGLGLVQGLNPKEAGLLDINVVPIKVALLLFGYSIVILWMASPWLLLVGVLPYLYYYQVYIIPRLKAGAYTDAKTGLSNMRHFDKLFKEELTRSSRLNQPLSIIMLDIDNLGTINNTYGHLAGDGAISTVSGTIKAHTQGNEVAARLGGEEFAVVLPEVDTIGALRVAESLRKNVTEARFDTINHQTTLQTSVSIGVATFPQHGTTTLDLIHAADVSMYHAKTTGKNRVISADKLRSLLGQDATAKESTEVINYRAAFAPSSESQEGETDTTPGILTPPPMVQTKSDENIIGKKVAPPIPSLGNIDHRRQDDMGLAEGKRNLFEHPKQATTPNVDHRTPLSVHNMDSAVIKYQSELQNGPLPPQASLLPFKNTSASVKNGRHPKSNANTEAISQRQVYIATGLGLIVAGLGLYFSSSPINLVTLLLLGLAAAVVQMFQRQSFESTTVSVSAAAILVGTLLEGMPGLLTTSTIVVLLNGIRYRSKIRNILYNWSMHIMAGLVPWSAYLIGATEHTENLLMMSILLLASALVFYCVESIFNAFISKPTYPQNMSRLWDSQLRCLTLYYILGGFVALSMMLAYDGIGALGVALLSMPIVLIFMIQRPYAALPEKDVQDPNPVSTKLIKANADIKMANLAFQRLTEELFLMLGKIIDARDPDVHGHAAQVANYAEAIAREIGLKHDAVEQIRYGGLLHDIGKLGISESILYKPGPLTDEEYEIMKSHATIGADFLETCQGLRSLTPFVRHHHEWWNGGGYPSGLYQEQIPLGARILAVCDAVEAMASDRPYRKGLSHEKIRAELENCKGRQFDPFIVNTFIKIIEREGPGFLRNTAGQSSLTAETVTAQNGVAQNRVSQNGMPQDEVVQAT